jgi:hypothetical protein
MLLVKVLLHFWNLRQEFGKNDSGVNSPGLGDNLDYSFLIISGYVLAELVLLDSFEY